MSPENLLRPGILTLVGLATMWLSKYAGASSGPEKEVNDLAAGKELFTREWLPGDKRSHAGDGLGPVFNARSCAACHSQGGVGGSGSRKFNATVVSAFVDLSQPFRAMTGIAVEDVPNPKVPHKQPDRDKLAEIHPALKTVGFFSLHRSSTDPMFETWKSKTFESRTMVGSAVKIGDVNIALIPSERNTPALFGAGVVEQISDRVLEQVASEQEKLSVGWANRKETLDHVSVNPRNSRSPDENPLPISGRVSRLKDGKIGRFGWKANVASLREFTLQACSNEMGLEVPGFPRAAPPWIKDYKAPGIDMTAEQCDRLIQFVSSLPRPVVRAPETPQHGVEIVAGRKLFGNLGCASCHQPKLGDVDGIYSDLLLHDMGQSLSGTGFYNSNVQIVKSEGKTDPLPVNGNFPEIKTKAPPPKFGAGPREWRTPPLWGLRDSAPYLHDGRADTIANAIEMHGGEGLIAARAFEKLTPRERLQLELFLQSLAAPAQN